MSYKTSASISIHEGEDGGSLVFRNVGILPQNYAMSQDRRHRLESSSMSEAKIWQLSRYFYIN